MHGSLSTLVLLLLVAPPKVGPDATTTPPSGADAAAAGADAAPSAPATASSPDAPRPASRPVLEQRVYLDTLEKALAGILEESSRGLSASDEERARIESARQTFLERQELVRREVAARMKVLMEARKAAPTTEPPSPEFRKEMEALRARQPRIAELQQQVDAILGTERAAALREAFEQELARARRALAEKAEADRKAREAERRQATGTPKGKNPGTKPEAEPTEGGPSPPTAPR